MIYGVLTIAPQNRIKMQAHEHPRFRKFAARYGQAIHQLNMRLSVALLRNVDAEMKAKEKAEAPTVKTKEQMDKEEEQKAKNGTAAKESSHIAKEQSKSIWRRKFRPLPDAKAVDLFADALGDAVILGVAIALIIYEYYRSSQKPDANEKIKVLDQKLEELRKREEDLEEAEKRQQTRVHTIEEALRNIKDPRTKQPLLILPTPSPAPTV